MADITLLPSAKVPLIYDGELTMTTEWYRFFWNIYGYTATGAIPVNKGGTGLTSIGDHQVIIGNASNVFEPAVFTGSGINISYAPGIINLAIGASGIVPGTYGSASQVGVFTVNQYGILTAAVNTNIGIDASQIISGTLPVIRGGTGQSTYTDGQLLIGNSTGNTLTKATLTAGAGISVSNGAGAITIANTGVLSVSGTAPVVSSGGATPAISMPKATSLVDGYLSSTDWTTFNNKAPATSGISILYGNGSGGFSNVTIGTGISFVGGTLSSTGSGGTVTSVSFTGGIISVATATTTPALTVAGTSGGIPYFSSATTWASSATLTANALMIGGGAGVAPSTITTGTGVVTALGVNTGTAGAFVVNGGALGTPSSGTVTNLTGTAAINITGTAPADNLTGTTLSSTVVTSSLTIVGTIGTGVWQGTAVAAAYGGTGQSSYAVGDILYASTTTALSKLADVATGNALISGGVGVAPSYGKIGLTTHISGTLAVGNGGTGLTTLTAGYIPFGNGTSAFGSTANLVWNGTQFVVTGLIIGTSSIYTGDGNSLTFGGAGTTFIGGTSTSNFITFNTASTERARIFASGGVSIGNTTDPGATNLSVSGTTNTASGTTSAANLTATTIYTMPTLPQGLYIVQAALSNNAPATFTAVSLVTQGNGTSRATALAIATNMTISVSGLNIQATQSAGGTVTISWAVFRIA